jgi:hypothetical protein
MEYGYSYRDPVHVQPRVVLDPPARHVQKLRQTITRPTPVAIPALVQRPRIHSTPDVYNHQLFLGILLLSYQLFDSDGFLVHKSYNLILKEPERLRRDTQHQCSLLAAPDDDQDTSREPSQATTAHP